MSLQNLINKCGTQKVINLLPSLFITVDTDKIDTENIICENDYFMNPQNVVNVLYKSDCAYDYEIMIEMIHNLAPIVELFHEMAIDKAMYDSVVISYLGKKHLRFNNKSDKKFGKTLYLDVHTVRIALTDMQTKQTISRIFGTGLKLCIGTVLFSILHRHSFDKINFLCLRYWK
jgi:hypothetical protein